MLVILTWLGHVVVGVEVATVLAEPGSMAVYRPNLYVTKRFSCEYSLKFNAASRVVSDSAIDAANAIRST